jgi:hypothetical protein
MGGGGGKGGGQTQTTEIPAWLRDPTIRNLERAETVQQMEYQPYTGADVAAFTPTQQAAMQMNLDSANAFGMMPSGYSLTPTSGMPVAKDYGGGMMGYSSAPLYEAAVASARAADPRTAGIRDAIYNAPITTRKYGNLTARDVGGADYSKIV